MMDRRLTGYPALRTCLCALYAAVRAVVPTHRAQIAFTSYPDCSDNAYALFEEVMRSPKARDFRLVWLVQDPAYAGTVLNRDYPNTDLIHVILVPKNTFRGLFLYLRSRWVFYTHGVYWFARAGYHQTIVNLWHGMPIKTIGSFLGKSSDEIPFAHYSIATSHFFAEIIARSMLLPRERVFAAGLPRNEWLFRPAPKIGDRAKVVVWLPTYRSSDTGEVRRDSAEGAVDPLDPMILSALDEKLDGSDTLLVIKLHPMDVKNRRVWPSYRNIDIYSDEKFRAADLNLYRVLASASALITDFSSVAIDYSVLRKPIGFFMPDMLSYTRGFIPSVLDRIATVGFQLKSVDELAAFIREPSRFVGSTAHLDDLYEPNARRPSQEILRRVNLHSLLSSGANETGALQAERPGSLVDLGGIESDSEPNSLRRESELTVFRVLGVPVSIIDMALALRRIDQRLRDGRGGFICIRDTHGVMHATKSSFFKSIHDDAFIVTPDGMPLVWLGQLYGHNVRRVCGPDLMSTLCALSVERGYRHYFYGGTEAVLQKLMQRLKANYPGICIAGYESPPLLPISISPDREACERIASTRPDIIWVGLGSPKQEYWMHANAPLLGGAVLIGVGAAFDFHSGSIPRAPAWMQRNGLEWLFRLCCEPRRLWRRYLFSIPKFIMLAGGEFLLWRMRTSVHPRRNKSLGAD